MLRNRMSEKSFKEGENQSHYQTEMYVKQIQCMVMIELINYMPLIALYYQLPT